MIDRDTFLKSLIYEVEQDRITAREVYNGYAHIPVQGRRVLDIGMNCGYYTALALQNGAKVVWGVEPLPRNLRIARKLLGEDTDRLRIIAAAAMPPGSPVKIGFYSGASIGRGKNFGRGTVREKYDTNHKGIIEVDTICFDTLIRELRPHVVKMDCEGSEHRLLRGISFPSVTRYIFGEIHFHTEEHAHLWPFVRKNLIRQGFKATDNARMSIKYGYYEWAR